MLDSNKLQTTPSAEVTEPAPLAHPEAAFDILELLVALSFWVGWFSE